MKLTELFEDGPTKSTEEYDKFIALVKQKFKNNLLHLAANPDKALWRGGEDSYMTQADNFISYKVQQSQQNRKSLTGKSYLNLIQANSPQWKKFPPRTNSTFCTTSYDNAYEFGTPLLLLPADSINSIATCAKDWNDLEVGSTGRRYEVSDISGMISQMAWGSQKVLRVIEDDYLNIPQITKLLNKNIIDSVSQQTNSYADLMQFIDIMDNVLNYCDEHLDELENDEKVIAVIPRLKYLRDYIIKNFGQIPSKWFKDNFKPEKIGCYRYSSYVTSEFYETEANEVWFSGEYLLLELPSSFHKMKAFTDLVKSVKE
jgi:hypothetical protein